MSMLDTIIAKSDQLTADDLIGRPLTLRITRVLVDTASEQPVSIHYDGDDDRPFRPCKSMRRVLVKVWGPDANAYVGRSMTVYRDDTVRFGGLEVGGIRISHMTHLEQPLTMALTATRASRKPFTVRPLVVETPPAKDRLREATDKIKAKLAAAVDAATVQAIKDDANIATYWRRIEAERPELAEELRAAETEATERTASEAVSEAA